MSEITVTGSAAIMMKEVEKLSKENKDLKGKINQCKQVIKEFTQDQTQSGGQMCGWQYTLERLERSL